MNFKKMTKKLCSLAVVAVAAISVASCGPDDNDEKTYTYNTYTAQSPSNWNELTYQDNNDTQIMSYIAGSFFTYDFKYDAKGNIIDGEYEVMYSAATKLEDVTADYEGAASAYKITLREDLKWDDGTPIDASDFVYTMKEQLDPLARHYRADSFYVGSTIIKNAQKYALQGQSDYFGAHTIYDAYDESLDEVLYFKLGPVVEGDEITTTCHVRDDFGFPASYDVAKTAQYLITNYGAYFSGTKAFTAEAAVAMEGKSFAEIKADPTLAAALDDIAGFCANGYGGDALLVAATYYTYPEMDFSEVGIFVGDTKYELVVVLDKGLELLKEDGSLDYKAAYNFSSLPLVHKEKWEENKVAPSAGNDLWTSTYCTSVSSTASWGPYSLVSFQSGKEYKLERNANWYGYNMPEYEGQYQTDRIVCETIAEWNTAWVKFLAGEIDGIGIDVSVADDYKGSERAYFTPDDFVASLQLQSSYDGLKERQEKSEGVNKTILTYTDFRKALSLSINRDEFATQTTTSSKAGFGLFNSMHYYDVANGGVYRNTDPAKKVLCDVYSVDYTKYDSLDAAVNAITGYNLPLAKELVESAYKQAVADGEISATDKVVLTLGTGTINETVQRRFDYIIKAWTELVKGTSLEGRLECEVKDFGTAWSNDFRNGAYDVCMGGWTGAAWDPGYFLLAYLSPDYMYSKAWNTSTQTMTFTMLGKEYTMTLMEWYDCLNGNSGCKYNWGSGKVAEADRLTLIAALEKEILSVYYTVPLYNNFSASLISYKLDYTTYTYNTFMGYGGIRYATYNYTDAEWEDVVADNNGQLNYK